MSCDSGRLQDVLSAAEAPCQSSSACENAEQVRLQARQLFSESFECGRLEQALQNASQYSAAKEFDRGEGDSKENIEAVSYTGQHGAGEAGNAELAQFDPRGGELDDIELIQLQINRNVSFASVNDGVAVHRYNRKSIAQELEAEAEVDVDLNLDMLVVDSRFSGKPGNELGDSSPHSPMQARPVKPEPPLISATPFPAQAMELSYSNKVAWSENTALVASNRQLQPELAASLRERICWLPGWQGGRAWGEDRLGAIQ